MRYNQGMKIIGFIWHKNIVEKLAAKHHVTPAEVEEVFASRPKIRLMEKGNYADEDVYIALGQANSGRYLAVLFIYKLNHQALILSARDMAKKERKAYGRK